jgi:hypothetical protein
MPNTRWLRRSKILDSKGGIDVPGGIIIVDLYRGKGALRLWTKLVIAGLLGSYAVVAIKRDVVIQDPLRERELYREGPYDQITVSPALQRMTNEIKTVGLNEFLKIRQVENARVGPVSISAKPVGFAKETVPYLSSFERLFARRKTGTKE